MFRFFESRPLEADLHCQVAARHHDADRRLASSINIMQVLISRSRLAGEPTDVLVTPRLADLGLMEFHRASLAIEVGRHAVEQVMPHCRHCCTA